MPEIVRSVGLGGKNDDADVVIVQRLLNGVSVARGGPNPILQIDGLCGPLTDAAIKKFQAKALVGIADGRVDPGKKTIKALNDAATANDARTVPDVDLDPSAQARLDASQASIWGAVAHKVINSLIPFVQTNGSVAGFDPIVETALAAHFHIDGTTPKDTALTLLQRIRTNYTAALVEISAGLHFHSVTRGEMHKDFAGAKPNEAPGYTPFTAPHRMCWSALFHVRGPTKPGYEWTGAGFGPKCRAAMVLHEPIHFVDPQANFDVYEWGPEYTALTAERASHGASCYPSFAAHVAERSTLPLGPRYGAGRPAD